MPAGRREIGQGSSRSFQLAVQHEDVIFQAAAEGNFGDLREDKGVIEEGLVNDPQISIHPAPHPKEQHLEATAWDWEEGSVAALIF